MKWTLKEHSRNTHEIVVELKGGEEFYALLTSDRHWDHPHSDQALQKKHLDEARAKNAPVIDYGDLFCAMQGKYDKRSDKQACRLEHQKDNYLDSLVNTGADFFAPYADIIAVVGPGNHETAIQKNHETDLTSRLVERMRARNKRAVTCVGGFSGFVRFSFRRATFRTSKVLHYFHGSGGGGPVTRGVIQTNRMAAYLSDADIVATGHTHDEWAVPIPRIRLGKCNHVERTEQLHIRTPGYKDEFRDGHSGWWVETGKSPRPVGACWLRFKLTGDDVRVTAIRTD